MSGFGTTYRTKSTFTCVFSVRSRMAAMRLASRSLTTSLLTVLQAFLSIRFSSIAVCCTTRNMSHSALDELLTRIHDYVSKLVRAPISAHKNP